MKHVNKPGRKISFPILKLSVACLLLLISFNKAKASVNNYTFTSGSATYTPITGTALFSGTWDDAASALLTIPFTFNYNGTAYTTLSVSTNGFITMGAVPATTYCGLQASAFNSIAGYGTDLVNGNATSNIAYVVNGSTPNRQFIVQYTDAKHYGATGDLYTFQIILNETSNTVQVRYGPITSVTTMGANSCTDAANESGNVGLLGASTSDYNIRSVTNGSNTWATSIAGVALSAVCNLSPSNIPSSGYTYTWTPPVPAPMVFSSSTTVLLNNGEINGQGSVSNKIFQVQVVTTGNLSPLSIGSLSLSTTGCTNALTDIANAKVYFTGTSGTFSSLTQFGSTITSPNGAYTVTGSATLGEGTNYFWVTYDLNSGATLGNLLKGCCTQLTGPGTVGTRVPTVTCPTGSHSVGAPSGFWTAINAPAPSPSGGVSLILSDGTVMAKSSSGGSGSGNLWNRLTPDASGSYINGTWTTLAPMIDTRLYFSSQVLKDGRVYVAGGEYGTGLQQAETYNPLTNVWTAAPSPGVNISDANSEILEDGRVLQALVTGALTANNIYNPVTNTYITGPNCLGIHNESAWVKLPDNSVLQVDRLSTNSERYIPATNTWVADATVPVALYDPFGYETGGALLLPDGRAFFIGSLGHTAYYTPSGTSSPGVWAAGPDIPGGQGVPDGPAAMMVNGKILMSVSPAPTAANHFPTPTAFYEFDYLTNTYTLIPTPFGGLSTNLSCYVTNLTNLPDGKILYSTQGSSQYYVYTPGSPQLSAGKPIIANVIQTSCTSFKITGTKFNGISQGSTYGDDWQMSTNYPIIRLSNGSNVYYCRTFDWNSTGVQRGSLADTTQFTLPAGLPIGTYSLVVTANGISSDPVLFTPKPYLTSTLTPAAICSNTTFAYTPTMAPAAATFTWTRAAVAGISNAAVTTPQTSNPNEVLINTTGSAMNVVYTFVLTSNGCTNTQNVTVSVKPKPTVTITGNTSFCSGGSTTLNAGAGYSSYSWSTGLSTQTITATASGIYSVTVTNASGCTATSAVTVTAVPTTPINQSATSCNSYFWSVNSTTYTTTGIYTASFTSSIGCDSNYILNLTINHIVNTSTTASACGSYVWFATTYTVSGNYMHTTLNASGCMNTDTLHLTINNATTNASTISACNSYTWFGNTYTVSGNYTHTVLTAAGCLNSDTLHLTINHTTTTSSTITACNSYTWFATTYTVSGNYTHTSLNASGCINTDTLHLTINYGTSTTNAVNATGCYTWGANNTTYSVSGTYTHTSLNASGCVNTQTLILTISPGVLLAAKAMLSGPYVSTTGLMNDHLRSGGLIPNTEPYSSAPYSMTNIGGSSGETVTNTILSVTGSNAIVDWVVLELRSAANSSNIVANKRALIQRDGDIVSNVDGFSPVTFPTVPAGNYFVSIKHRNHLGIMSANAISFSGCALTTIDLTSSAPVYLNTTIINSPRRLIGAMYTLWSADANNNKNVKYNGSNNDKNSLLNAVGAGTPNNIISNVYRVEDLNMDGIIRYNNTNNDRQVILDNVGVNTPNVILFQHTPN